MGTELKKNSRNDVMEAIKAIAIISVICVPLRWAGRGHGNEGGPKASWT